MAAKKAKSRKKVASKAQASGKKAAKKVAKKAKGLLGKLAQRSAQLVLDTGILGEPPKRAGKRASAKKRPRKA